MHQEMTPEANSFWTVMALIHNNTSKENQMTSVTHSNITADAVRSIRDQMLAQSGTIGAEFIKSDLELLRAPAQVLERHKVEQLSRNVARLMLEHARVDEAPCLSTERRQLGDRGATQTTIRVVAVHPDLWTRITRLLRDLEGDLR